MALAEVPLADTLARPLGDLRISVTDRCQFRCTYCMPREVFGRDFAFLPREELLTFEELARLARVFAGLGVRKLRLTGGEPLLRRDLERLVAMLARVDGIQDIALTTNGALLAGKAQALAAAGLRRVTVSLDSLDDTVFMALNDAGFPVARVLDAIAVAAGAGLAPAKVNMVVRRGVNDQSILPLAAHFRHSGHVLRFIEYMDVGTTNGWRLDDVVPAAEIISLIDRQWPLEPVDPAYPGEVARRYRYRDDRAPAFAAKSGSRSGFYTGPHYTDPSFGRRASLCTNLRASHRSGRGPRLRACFGSGRDDAGGAGRKAGGGHVGAGARTGQGVIGRTDDLNSSGADAGNTAGGIKIDHWAAGPRGRKIDPSRDASARHHLGADAGGGCVDV